MGQKLKDKLIITAAITGSRILRDTTPYIPYAPEEIARSAIECWNAGASIVHIHVRDPETGLGTQNLDLFQQVVELLREKTDVVINLTTSGIAALNLPVEDRLTSLELKPELASFDAGSINLGKGVFTNPPDFLNLAAETMKRLKVKPEIEVFDSGMIVTAVQMRNRRKLDDALFFEFVLGTPYGAPATAKTLVHLSEIIPENAIWSVTGIGRAHLPMSMMALAMGGHIRTGMEDHVFYNKGELAINNAQFVERIVRIANEYGREVASPDETRKILGLTSREGR